MAGARVPGVAPVRGLRIRVRGTVQGVGFRPFVYRLASEHGLTGWVLNDDEGVQIHVEGTEDAVDAFLRQLPLHPPPAARIDGLEASPAPVAACDAFVIRQSERRPGPTAHISPDLAICPACVRELFDPEDARFGYPYINCTDCGPRFSVLLGLPYDRAATTMRDWELCERCAAAYGDPGNRRFHAEPVACPACGPHYMLLAGDHAERGDAAAIGEAAALLREGRILAIKGLGGYHLACDAMQRATVAELRERKYRKEKPFAIMVPDIGVARRIVELSPEAEQLLRDVARPIVLARARVELPTVAPENQDLGVMLPYAPLHHLLFAHGAPEVLVLTSGNRSSEPIAYRDADAFERLSGIADAFLLGERPIARRLDDSVARPTVCGPVILRRSRGYAPAVVSRLPSAATILAVGADLKNTITLVVRGDAVISQHVGDLEHYEAYTAFQETIRDLTAMYELDWRTVRVAHDLHPEYASTRCALALPAASAHGVQHHRAHVASVLAEREAFDARVVGVAFDGTGYGDDGTIWGGELFVGSVNAGFDRVAHLRSATLPGGDAAARHPVQAAAGFLAHLDGLGDMMGPPFRFPARYQQAQRLVTANLRCFPTTSVGRLFDTVAALVGFTRPVSFEGQAAIWLEQLSRCSEEVPPYPLPFVDAELDFRPALRAVIEDRIRGRADAEIGRAFHGALARATAEAIRAICAWARVDTVVVSGGVFQNQLLLEELRHYLGASAIRLWINHRVPPNDGGVSLGQAALLAAADPSHLA
jgi:hydrogenase maturation protein HypF